jgi:hypothetical protein
VISRKVYVSMYQSELYRQSETFLIGISYIGDLYLAACHASRRRHGSIHPNWFK